MDKNQITQELVDQMDVDIQQHPMNERTQMMDWLMANQLTKSKKNIALMESWEHSPSPLQRRIYWYYQARLRWTGQTPPSNTEALLDSIETRMAGEKPEVQWAMNFTACQIGVYDPKYRDRCIEIGEKTGLYKYDPVAKNCTPNYIPEFVRIQVDKLKKQ